MISDQELQELDIYSLDEGALEAENRLKNLMWTVSGDYGLDTKLDIDSFSFCKYVAMYDAVKQGGFARYFDKDAFALYLAKKLYFSAAQQPLTGIAQLCVDAAAYPLVVRERPGVRQIRREAFSYLLEHRFRSLNETMVGKLKLSWMRGSLYGKWENERRIMAPLEKVRALEAHRPDTRLLMETVDVLYNALIEPDFVKKHGDLDHVLETSLEEMKEFGWRDFLDEDAFEELLEKYMDEVGQQVTVFDGEDSKKEEEQRREQKKRRIIQVDPEAAARMYSYIERNFGTSYLTETEQTRRNYRLCRGAHSDCSLYYTEGIIENKVLVNAQYVNAVKHAKNNQVLFTNSKHLVKRNVELLTDYLKRSLQLRTQTDQIPAYHGTVAPRLLWKVGRLEDPGRLFTLTTKVAGTRFAVEILMDASGSQRERQGQVAIQAYIISAALSGVGMPHRIESFCTFWDYTVMQRFRDFDDPPEQDRKVIQFSTSSNNRDGLAIRAAGDILSQRPEENKILIVLSDGKPNDVIVNRPGSRNPKPYAGDYAVQDTAYEVRSLRGQGIFVLGVFTGRERDLSAEKKIFGRDFAYVRDIRNFSRVVSVYLHRVLEQDTGEV